MRERVEWRAVLSMVPAMTGMGLASGRELALFFGQLKSTAWLGIAAALIFFSSMTAILLWQSQTSFSGTGMLSVLCTVLGMLTASLAAAIMLSRLGEMGELALPLRHSYAFGAALGGFAALFMMGIDRRWIVGLGLYALLLLFYAACAIDPAPVRVYAAIPVEFTLAGSRVAALALAFAYASMNACACMWCLYGHARDALRPVPTGIKAMLILAVPLALAKMALNRGGDAILPLRMPWVPLCARWGLPGFWICIGLEYTCAAATLSAALKALLKSLARSRRERPLAVFMLTTSLVIFGVLTHGRSA